MAPGLIRFEGIIELSKESLAFVYSFLDPVYINTKFHVIKIEIIPTFIGINLQKHDRPFVSNFEYRLIGLPFDITTLIVKIYLLFSENTSDAILFI